MELREIGLGKLFFKMRADNLDELATALGYESHIFNRVVKKCGLIDKRGLIHESWERKLRLQISQYKYYNQSLEEHEK